MRKIEKALLDQVLLLLPRADAVVLSDYAKGVLTPTSDPSPSSMQRALPASR